jgi:nucleoside-triphosphatase THEP1
MDKPKVTINIKGAQGSGKTGLWNILREALENNGYNTIRLNPHGKYEDRLLTGNDFHIITMETEQTKDCDGNCGMNYCDDNGCLDRKRVLVEPIDETGKEVSNG